MTGSQKELTQAQIKRAVRYLERLRAQWDCSVTEVGRRLGMKQARTNKAFKEDLGLDTLERIAKHARLPVEFFLHGAPDALERVLWKHGTQWSNHTLISAIHLSRRTHESTLTERDWIELLDRLERTLDSFVSEIRSKRSSQRSSPIDVEGDS